MLILVLLWGPLQILETWYGPLIGAAAFAIEAFLATIPATDGDVNLSREAAAQ